MKVVKAYIRSHMIDLVIQALEQAGFTDMTILEGKGITRGLRRQEYQYSLELAERYQHVVKIEIVCRDRDVDRIMALIIEHARTGKKGDGLVYVSPAEKGIRILDGSRIEEDDSG